MTTNKTTHVGAVKTVDFTQLRQLSAPQFTYTPPQDSQLERVCDASELTLLAELYDIDITQPQIAVPDRGAWLHIHCRKDGGYVFTGVHSPAAVKQNIIQMLQIYQLGKMERSAHQVA